MALPDVMLTPLTRVRAMSASEGTPCICLPMAGVCAEHRFTSAECCAPLSARAL